MSSKRNKYGEDDSIMSEREPKKRVLEGWESFSETLPTKLLAIPVCNQCLRYSFYAGVTWAFNCLAKADDAEEDLNEVGREMGIEVGQMVEDAERNFHGK